MSRGLFNVAKVADRLKADFVTAGTGLETLASLDPSVIQWFATAAAHAIVQAGQKEYLETYKTFQGMYVVGADGTAYAFLSLAEPNEFLKQLDGAVAAFKKKPPAKVELGDAEIRKGQAAGPAASVSVVRLYYRCTPLPEGAHPVNRSVGRDHLWIFADEVREIVRTTALPRKVAARLARFHLLDNVRGLADSFAAADVKRANFTVKRVREGTYALTGDFVAEREYPGDANYKGKAGVEGKLEGEFVVEGEKIVRFRAVVDAQAWGAGTNTWHQPKAKFPLVIAMTETSDAVSRAVGPVWREYGLDYGDPEWKLK